MSIQKNEKKFRLDEQIRQSIMQLETRWTEKEIEFDVDLDRVEFKGNATLLIHVWDNLIGNAIKFDPMGGTIKIRLTEANGTIKFVIEDNGTGIEEEALKHIFDKFYQGDTSHKSEGNGLGLYEAAFIARKLGGDIAARYLEDSEETEFEVFLPL